MVRTAVIFGAYYPARLHLGGLYTLVMIEVYLL